MSPKDDFIVFVPNGLSLPRLCFGYAAVERALDELGRKDARVRRVTEDELCLDVTSEFIPEDYVAPVAEEYPDDEAWTRWHTRQNSRAVPYGRL